GFPGAQESVVPADRGNPLPAAGVGGLILAAVLSAAALAAPPVVVPCGDVIGPIARPPAPTLLGVVVPPPRRVGQFVKVQQHGWTRWRKTPRIVRAGSTPVTVSVPRAWRSRVAII